jgi:hypothetical protein
MLLISRAAKIGEDRAVKSMPKIIVEKLTL